MYIIIRDTCYTCTCSIFNYTLLYMWLVLFTVYLTKSDVFPTPGSPTSTILMNASLWGLKSGYI